LSKRSDYKIRLEAVESPDLGNSNLSSSSAVLTVLLFENIEKKKFNFHSTGNCGLPGTRFDASA
jgi:hypothetical protein